MDMAELGRALDNVRATVPLVHCITNYVTVNDCANALLACGGSPIMSDEPDDVEDITSICGGLVLNIGTLNRRSIEGMRVAGRRAGELGHAIVLDPVGAGASKLRTDTATELIDTLPVTVVRGNMSEVKTIAGSAAATRGVDVNPDDAVTEDNLAASAEFARSLAAKLGAVVAITGAIDIVASADRAVAIRNGVATMGKITGTGCMLTCVVAAYTVANPDDVFGATVAAVAGHGLAGEVAAARMAPADGNGSFRTYLLDAICNMSADRLMAGAKIEEL
ncbi:hydroxyethylthiazole kinase [Candidatus Collinsella stercoripullorum]|uniref:hydroxyethylthiazole kinase n=1 Tax=Candidatus Collinsella stercoripullorum TaxID=2838522 RepID=UPI0022E607D8|nr:hydroxyethylthiazole kinase [Candidatus Collinsella stercoripullorum]